MRSIMWTPVTFPALDKRRWEGEFTLRSDPWAGLIASCGSFYLMVSLPHRYNPRNLPVRKSKPQSTIHTCQWSTQPPNLTNLRLYRWSGEVVIIWWLSLNPHSSHHMRLTKDKKDGISGCMTIRPEIRSVLLLVASPTSLESSTWQGFQGYRLSLL